MQINSNYSMNGVSYETRHKQNNIPQFSTECAVQKNENINPYMAEADFDEKAFDMIGPNTPRDVKDAWMEAAKDVNANGMGIKKNGMLSHISQMMVQKKFALAGGGTLNCPILTTGGYGAEIQYQGVTVLSNLGNGWGYEMTPAELAKKDEFYSIYWSEYNLVKESGSSELRDYLNQDRPSFEARA